MDVYFSIDYNMNRIISSYIEYTIYTATYMDDDIDY